MQSKASSVAQYLAQLPPDRRAAIEAVRKVFAANMDKDIREGMEYGMIGYAIPHEVYPPGYHCKPEEPLPYAGLASQANHLSLYMMALYGHQPTRTWFEAAWKKTGKKLDMGKACIRFKTVDDLPLDVLAEAIRRVPAKAYIEHYEAMLNGPRPKREPANAGAQRAKAGARSVSAKPATAKPAKKKAPAKRAAAAKRG